MAVAEPGVHLIEEAAWLFARLLGIRQRVFAEANSLSRHTLSPHSLYIFSFEEKKLNQCLPGMILFVGIRLAYNNSL